MRVREVISLLQKLGWIEIRARGSHRNFKYAKSPYVELTVKKSRLAR
jgi:predicted RNA binding protein YcfA (HicA-like mRNA interferase family)